MNRGLVLLASLTLLLACGPHAGDAQTSGSAAPPVALQPAGITLEQVLDRYAAALGGLDRLRSIKTVRMSGRMTNSRDVNGDPVSIDKERAGGKYLRRLVTNGITVIQAVDGPTIWEVDPGMDIPKPRAMNDRDASRFRHRLDVDGPLVDYRAKGNQVQLLGKQKVAGGDAYRLRIRYKDGGTGFFLIDAKTFLPVEMIDLVPQSRGPLEVTTRYTDFRKAGGLLWPFSEETVLPNFSQRLIWDKVEVDVPVDDTEFKMPS